MATTRILQVAPTCWSFLAFSLFLLLLTMGCSTASSPAGGVDSAIPDEVVVGLGDDVPFFSATHGYGGVQSYVRPNIFDGLVGRDTDLKVIPALATSWKVSPDGKSYEFKLRKGVTYVNGDPFRVEDIAFRFAKGKDPVLFTGQLTTAHWKQVEIVDDETVRYTLDWPDPGFLGGLAGHLMVPKQYYESIGGEEAFEKALIGTGPYKVVDRRIKEGWTLERYEGYWGEKPQIRRAVFKVIPEPSTRAAALKVGEIDFSANFSPSHAKDLEKTGGFKIIKNPSGNVVNIRINKHRKTDPKTGEPNPFLDKRVRQAIAYSIDRDAIIEKILDGIGEKIAILFPEDFGYDPELKPYPYDPAKAKRLLADAGYPNGIEATFYGLLGERVPASKEVGEVVAQYMTAIGIRTKVINEEYTSHLERSVRARSEGKPNEPYPMIYGYTWVAGEGSPYLKWWGLVCDHMNTWWTCDPEFDRMHEQLRLEGDPAKSEAIVKALARRAHEEQYLPILYRNVTVYAMKDRLEFTPEKQSTYVELKNMRWK